MIKKFGIKKASSSLAFLLNIIQRIARIRLSLAQHFVDKLDQS